MQPMTKENFSGYEAAQYLGIHPQTVKAWRKSGKLRPQFEHNQLTLYSREYLDAVKAEMVPTGKLKRGRPVQES